MKSCIRSIHLGRVLFWTVFVLIMVISLGLSSYRLGEPLWEKGSHGFHMSEYPHNALNYLRFGYLETKLGLVENFGGLRPEHGFNYRVDHGFITPLSISLVYRIFGIQPWSARLAPLLLAMGTVIITYLLMYQLGEQRWSALLALFFVALSPTLIFYARLPAPHNLGTFFALLVFLVYWRWFKTKYYGYAIGIFVVLSLGTFTNWIVYFTIVPILAHYLMFWEGRRSWRFVSVLLISPILLFASYLLWVYLLNGDSSLVFLWNKFLFRTVSSGAGGSPYIFTLQEYWSLFNHRAIDWLGTPIVLLSLAWFAGFLGTLFKQRKVPASQGLIFVLFLFGFSHNILFSNRVYIHDFIMFFHLIPVFAIASASAVAWFVNRYEHQRRVLAVVAVLITCALFIEQSLGVYSFEHHSRAILPEAYYIGRALNETVSLSGSYIDAANLGSLGERRIYVTADRPYSPVHTLPEFSRIENSDPLRNFEAVIVSNSDATDVVLRRYLVEHYPRTEVAGLSIFELNEAGSDILVEDPAIENPRHIVFEDDIEFLGFDLETIVNRQEQAGWLDRYLTKQPELLPQHRTLFRVVNYWRRLTPEPVAARLITEFDARQDQAYQLGQRLNGLDDLYPTPLWPTGQIIREEFEIEVPPDYPSLKYDMWIGVTNETKRLEPDTAQLMVDENKRVKVGQIDIRPFPTPAPLPNAPQPQVKTQKEIDHAIQLFGYDIDIAETGTLVTTYWQKTADTNIDYEFFLSMGTGLNAISQRISLPPSRLWEVGEFYVGSVAFSPNLLTGQYGLDLIVMDEHAQPYEVPLSSVNWCNPSTQFVVHQLGQPDGSADDIARLSPDDPFTVDFELLDRQDVDLVVGWTGKSQYDQTRIVAFAQDERWILGKNKYLQTLAVSSKQPTSSRVSLPRRLTSLGRNTVELTIPDRTQVGWRRILASIIPGLEPLLRSSYLPYDGWIELDFVQVLLTEPPFDVNDLDDLQQYSPEQLIDLSNFVQNSAGCTELEDTEVVLKKIQTQLSTVDWSSISIDTLIYAQANSDPALLKKLEPHLTSKIPLNIDKILVDENARQKLRALGYSVSRERAGLELNIYFEVLDRLDQDYTISLHAQTGSINLLFDHNLSTSEWTPGRIYKSSFITQVVPGSYDLSFLIWHSNGEKRLYLDQSDDFLVSLGKYQIR